MHQTISTLDMGSNQPHYDQTSHVKEEEAQKYRSLLKRRNSKTPDIKKKTEQKTTRQSIIKEVEDEVRKLTRAESTGII